jgi:hypothetical protein
MTADNVVINFTGDTSGLQPVEHVLESIVAKGGEVGQQWSKASAAMTTANKATVDSSNKVVKSIADMAAAAKNMDKSLVGGAYKDYLKQIQSQLGLTNKELVTYINTAKKAAQQSIFDAQTQEEADQITAAIAAMNEQLAVLGDGEEKVTTKTQTLKAQLRAMKAELAGLEEGTAEFEALRKKAGELDDKIKDVNQTISQTGSDTAKIDGFISLAGGIAGGFAVAQSSAALFGNESEDVQKVLLKVNAAMSILQGLQQVQQVLQKESAASLLFTNAIRKKEIADTATQAVVTGDLAIAEGVQQVATEGATGATIGLNAAMAANPVAALIVGVVALIGILSYFGDEEEKLAKQHTRTNELLLEQMDLLDKLRVLYGSGYEQKILSAQLALSKAMVDGSSKTKQLAAELELLNVKYDEAYNQANKNPKYGFSDAIKIEVSKATQELDRLIQKEQELIAAGDKPNDEFKAIKSETEKNLQLWEKRFSEQKTIEDNFHQAGRERDAKIEEKKRYEYEQTIKSNLALSEAEVVRKKILIEQNQIDSIASLKAVTNAEINAINERYEAEQKLNPNLTEGERVKARKEADLQISELNNQLKLDILNSEKAAINAQLQLSAKGSQEEYDNKILFIDKEKQIKLAATKLTDEQIKEIEAQATIDKENALKVRKLAELQASKELQDMVVQNAVAGTKAELEAKTKQLDAATALEIANIDERVRLTEEGKAKIDEINNRNKNEKIKLQLDFDIKKIDFKKQLQDSLQNASISADQRILDSLKSTTKQRKQAEDDIYKLKIEGLEKEKNIINEKIQKEVEAAIKIKGGTKLSLDELLAINQKYQADLISLNDKAAQTDFEREQKAVKRKQDLLLGAIDSTKKILQESINVTLDTSAAKTALLQLSDLADSIFKTLNDKTLTEAQKTQAIVAGSVAAGQQIVNQIFTDAATARQQDLNDTIAALEEQKARELNAKHLTEQQKADIEKKYKERERIEKIKAFQADKEAKKEQAIINGLLAVTLAFASTPFPASLITAAIVAASTAIQVARINATPTPKFKSGKIDIDGPGTTTSDSIPAWISRGESVIKADSTAKWKDALIAINNDAFEPYLFNKFKEFVFPTVPDYVQTHTALGAAIDYDKLATAVADKMKGVIPASNSTHVTIDKDGIKTMLVSEHSKTEIKNQYFSMT